MSKQLQSELSHEERSLSRPSPERLHAWRLFFESALALLDVLDAELEQAAGIPQRWYDVLVHLEESPQGIPMNELADQILYSKSGFTRVVDRMEDAGLVRRHRPDNDRRTILIVLTDKGIETLERARASPPRRNPTTLLPTPHQRRHQSAHPRTRKDQRPRTTAPPRPHPRPRETGTKDPIELDVSRLGACSVNAGAGPRTVLRVR